MRKLIAFANLFIFITTVSADVFMTELTDPQNSADAGRYGFYE